MGFARKRFVMPSCLLTSLLNRSERSDYMLLFVMQAVEASELVAKGNTNLQKAIRLNSSTRKFMFCFFVLASLLLLFFDWWSS